MHGKRFLQMTSVISHIFAANYAQMRGYLYLQCSIMLLSLSAGILQCNSTLYDSCTQCEQQNVGWDNTLPPAIAEMWRCGGERGEGCLAQQLDNGCHTLPCFYIFCIAPKIRGCTLCGLDQGYIGGKEAGWWGPGRAHQPLSTQSHPTIHPPTQRQLLDASIFEMERGGLG